MTIMKRRFLASACALAIAANSFTVMAQDKKQEESKTMTTSSVVIEQTVDGTAGTFNVRVPGPQDTIFTMPGASFGGVWFDGAQEGMAQTYSFVSSEMTFDGKVVKGAPFSAESVTEFTQVLGDGNRIVRRSVSNYYRDGQGRTRREQTPFIMAPITGNTEQNQRIFITDPENNTTFNLDPNSRTAFKAMSFGRVAAAPVAVEGAALRQTKVNGSIIQGNAIKKVQPTYPPVAKAAGAEGTVQVQVTINESGDVTDASAISGHPLLRDSAVEAARQWKFKPTESASQPVKLQGILTFNFVLERKTVPTAGAFYPAEQLRMMHKKDVKSETLGKQMIEGIEATGTRSVETIAAGTIGNERPIEVINERWYSQELQTVIMTKHSDPRFGETVFKLTNINRSEPDAALFQVPSDYTVREGGFGFSSTMERKKRGPNEQ